MTLAGLCQVQREEGGEGGVTFPSGVVTAAADGAGAGNYPEQEKHF